MFAAGNSARRTEGDNGFVSFPANVNIPSVLTVGASDRDDLQTDYSPTANPGSSNNQIIDLTAPSHRAYPPAAYAPNPGGIAGETFEVWTIDIPGNTGYNPWPALFAPGVPNNINPPAFGEVLPNVGPNFNNYTARFGGTSAACPQVAATAALILSIYPNMTPQQVFNIITSSADPVGGYVYTNGVSNELGHGRLNACQALTEAVRIGTTISGPSLVCTSNRTFTVQNVPQGVNVTWSVSPASLFAVDTGTGNSFATRATFLLPVARVPSRLRYKALVEILN